MKSHKKRRSTKKIKFNFKKKMLFDQIIYLLFIILAILISLALIYSYTIRHNDAFELRTDLYELSEECSLSLCDCNCYITNELPEIIHGKICGNDCRGIMNIDDCKMIDNKCTIVYKE